MNHQNVRTPQQMSMTSLRKKRWEQELQQLRSPVNHDLNTCPTYNCGNIVQKYNPSVHTVSPFGAVKKPSIATATSAFNTTTKRRQEFEGDLQDQVDEETYDKEIYDGDDGCMDDGEESTPFQG